MERASEQRAPRAPAWPSALIVPSSGLGNRNGNGVRPAALPVDWEALARSTAHPLRVSILEVLGLDGGRTLSPSELRLELQTALGNVNYHVTELLKAGLVELVREQAVRGAVEHFYRRPDAARTS